jgi:TonB family protein
MKIVCDACSAKYSIADEKVKGKVFKIRCKKCSNIIVVRGNAGAAAEEPAAAPQGQFDQKETRVYDYGGYEGEGAPPPGDDAVWHVVIDQEQVGPITIAEVNEKFAAGAIDAETYIWREGFADWLPLVQVPEFAALASGGSTTEAQGGSAGADAVASMFGAATGYDDGGTSRSDPNDVFAAHAAKAAADDGGDEGADDLFGQSGAKKSRAADAGAFGGGKAAAPAAAAGASPSSLKGQRSENSVLFSLNNLAALASDSPKASPVASSSSPGTSGAAQHAGGEGSGLIDIRSMASAYLGAAKSPGGAPGGKSVGSIDDLPVFSTAAFSEPAVIIPSVGAGRGNNKLMYGLLGAVALLAIVLVVVVIVLVTGDKKGTTSASGQVAMGGGSSKGSDKASGAGSMPGDGSGSVTDPAPGSGSASASGASDGSGDDPGSGSGSGSGSDDVEDPGAGSAKPGSSDRKPSGSDRKPSGSDRKPSGSDRKPSGGTSGSSSKPPPDTGGKCLDEVACLLADKPPACCSKYRGGGGGGGGGGGDKKPPPSTAGLPEDLQKSHISTGIAKVRSRVEGCAAKSNAKGTVKVSVKVAGSGAVSSVTVKTSPDSALGSCVASAVKKATFAKTQNGGSFSYPFTFR